VVIVFGALLAALDYLYRQAGPRLYTLTRPTNLLPASAALAVLAAAALTVTLTRRVRRRRRTLRRRRGPVPSVRPARAQPVPSEIAAFQALTPTQFEEALAALCLRDGCTEVSVVGGAGDLGADVIATTPAGQRLVIQAKRYATSKKVTSQTVQIVNGTYRDQHRGNVAAIVTTSTYTAAARSYAEKVDIHLVDASGLMAWAVHGRPPLPWNRAT